MRGAPQEFYVFGETSVHVVASRPPTEQLTFGDVEVVLGGPAAVVAAQVGNLGHRPLLCSRIGTDALGDFAAAELTSVGVDLGQVERIGRTGRIVAVVDTENPRLLADAEALESASELRWNSPPPGSHVYVTAFPALLSAVRGLGEAGHALTVDAGFVPLLRDPEALMSHLRAVAPWSRTVILSAGQLESDIRARAAEACLAGGVRQVVLTRGSQPTEFVTQFGSTEVPVESVDARDTLCAGDAFVAGFLVASAEGCEGAGAVEAGHVVARAKTAMFGGLPARDQLVGWWSR